MVTVPPTIDLHPIGQQVDLNKDVNLNCMASGRPRPTISWSKDGAVLDIAGASRLEHAVNGSLIIRRVQSSDVGAYQCNASAGPFFAASREASVSIHRKCISEESRSVARHVICFSWLVQPTFFVYSCLIRKWFVTRSHGYEHHLQEQSNLWNVCCKGAFDWAHPDKEDSSVFGWRLRFG